MNASDARVLQAGDPEAARLIAAGWRVAARSWGARLRIRRPADLDRVRAAAVLHPVAELTVADAAEVAALDALSHAEYPQTPATPHAVLTAEAAAALFAEGRVFGVRLDGLLVAVTAVRIDGDRGETDFTSVHPGFRRRGLAAAVKAASVLALAATGIREFGTGGAAANTGSLAMNRALGYEIEQEWLSLIPPVA